MIVESALETAATHGQWDRIQYQYVAEWINRFPGDLLVWGCGRDSDFWRLSNVGGGAVFVETNPKWAEMARTSGCEVIDWQAPSRRGIIWAAPLPPNPAPGNWNAIIVDGPPGCRRRSAGRELPIRWAAKSTTKLIVLHDYNRPWERFCADRYLGEPTIKLVSFKTYGCGRVALAIWIRG